MPFNFETPGKNNAENDEEQPESSIEQKESYIDSSDSSITKQLSGPLKDHLTPETLEKLQRMKEKSADDNNHSTPPNSKAA